MMMMTTLRLDCHVNAMRGGSEAGRGTRVRGIHVNAVFKLHAITVAHANAASLFKHPHKHGSVFFCCLRFGCSSLCRRHQSPLLNTRMPPRNWRRAWWGRCKSCASMRWSETRNLMLNW